MIILRDSDDAQYCTTTITGPDANLGTIVVKFSDPGHYDVCLNANAQRVFDEPLKFSHTFIVNELIKAAMLHSGESCVNPCISAGCESVKTAHVPPDPKQNVCKMTFDKMRDCGECCDENCIVELPDNDDAKFFRFVLLQF